jgi:hypothetical protein
MSGLLIIGQRSVLAGPLARHHLSLFPRSAVVLACPPTPSGWVASAMDSYRGMVTTRPPTDIAGWQALVSNHGIQRVAVLMLGDGRSRHSMHPAEDPWAQVYAAGQLFDALEARARTDRRHPAIKALAVVPSNILDPAPGCATEQGSLLTETPTQAALTGLVTLATAARARGQLQAASLLLSDLFGPEVPDAGGIAGIVEAMLAGRRIPIYGAHGAVRWPLLAEDAARMVAALFDSPLGQSRYGLMGPTKVSQLALCVMIGRLLDTRMHAEPALRRLAPRCPAAQGLPCASLVSFVQDRREQRRVEQLDFSATLKAMPMYHPTDLERALAATVQAVLDTLPIAIPA